MAGDDMRVALSVTVQFYFFVDLQNKHREVPAGR